MKRRPEGGGDLQTHFNLPVVEVGRGVFDEPSVARGVAQAPQPFRPAQGAEPAEAGRVASPSIS